MPFPGMAHRQFLMVMLAEVALFTSEHAVRYCWR